MTMRDSFEHTMLYQCNYARNIDGEYVDVYTSAYWRVWQKAWQASRNAIVLPENAENHIAGEYGNGYADALHVCRLAIG